LVSLNVGSLTLSAVAMLSPYLTEQNAEELLAAAARKTNARIRELIAERFPQPDLPTLVQPVLYPPGESAPVSSRELGAANCQALAARRVETPQVLVTASCVQPLAPQRHAVQFTIGQSDLELLRRAQDLLSHHDSNCDAGEVFVRALRAFVKRLETKKFGLT